MPYIDVIDIDSDFLMLLRISKTFTLKDDDVCIVFVYLPPEGSDYSNNDSLSEIESDLLPFVESCRYFYVIGDLNARTGTTSEFLEFNLDQMTIDQYGIDNDVIGYLNNVQELKNHGISCHRISEDKSKNNFGNKLLHICQNNNLYICNGRLNSERTSAFTCIKGSIIDYLITGINGLLIVNNFTVHEYSPLLSDVHCALSFAITVRPPRNKISDNVTIKYKKWESARKQNFIENINRKLISELNSTLEYFDNNIYVVNKQEINNFTDKIKIIFQERAKSSFIKYPVISKKVKNSKPWFGLQCKKARKRYQVAKKNNSLHNTLSSRRIMINASKKYKSTVKKYHAKYIEGLQKKIRKLRTENPKDY